MIFIDNELKKIKNTNLFLTSDYENYVESQGDYYYTISDETFCMPFRFSGDVITLLSEPVIQKDSNCIYDSFLKESCEKIINDFSPSILRCLSSVQFKSYPQILGVKYIPFGTYVIDLEQSLDEIRKNMARSYRNQISNAIRNDIRIRVGDFSLISDFCKLELDTCQRSGMSVRNYNYYYNAISLLKNNSQIFVAYKDDVPQAGTIIFFDENNAYYRFAVTANNMTLGAMKYLQLFIMEYLKQRNVKKYLLYGIRINSDDKKIVGVNTYKERFGGFLDINYLFKIDVNKKSISNDIVEEEIAKWINHGETIKKMVLTR